MDVQLPPHAAHVDGSLSVHEAAEKLGCSEKTIRRRIKAGTLSAYQLPTSQGYEWRVVLDDNTVHPPPRPAVHLNGQAGQVPGTDQVVAQTSGHLDVQAPEPQNEALLKALSLVDRLQRENMELAGRVGFLQAKLQTAEERVLELASGLETPEAVAEAPEATEPPKPRRWYEFWRSG